MIGSTARSGMWAAGIDILAVALLLAWPALWNGYPLIYYDTEDYVEMSFTFSPIIFRVMPYAGIVAIARPFDSLFVVIWLQALVAAWVLKEFVVALAPEGWDDRDRAVAYMLLGLIIGLLTGYPWYVTQIMPDIFAGLIALIVAILAFAPDALPPWRRWVLAAILAVSVSVHMSHVALAGGLILALLAWWGLERMLSGRSGRAQGPVLALAALAIGILAVPAFHLAATGRFYFQDSGRVLQLALMIEDGLAKRYLDKHCPKDGLKLCPHKDNLPPTADDFLWGKTPFWNLGGWTGMREEAQIIVSGIVREFPKELMLNAIDNSWTQAKLILVGEDLDPKRWHFVKTIARRYPNEVPVFNASRQQTGAGIDFGAVNDYQWPLAWTGQVTMLIVLFFAGRRRDRATLGAGLVALALLFGNAVVCGALSNPHDRYQNRIVWIAVAVAGMGLARLAARRDPDSPPVT